MLSAGARYHLDKRRALLQRDPSLARLNGHNPWSLACIAVLIALHAGVAWSVRDGSVVRVFLAAFFVGQLVLHAGGALVHEAAHRLVLARQTWIVDAALELLLTSFGHHRQYQLDHLYSHHPYLGDYQRDYEHKDACRFRMRQALRTDRPSLHAALVLMQLGLDLLPLGFLVSDDLVLALERRVMGPRLSDGGRQLRMPRLPRRQRLVLTALSLLVLLTVGISLGLWALLYWVWSLSIFQGRMGVSNVGQVIAEHPEGGHITESTYGPWNWLLFNTGYHDEHHTFPRVAWNRLPELKRRAPDAFASCQRGYVRGWALYVWHLIPRRPRVTVDDERCV